MKMHKNLRRKQIAIYTKNIKFKIPNIINYKIKKKTIWRENPLLQEHQEARDMKRAEVIASVPRPLAHSRAECLKNQTFWTPF